jgi:hypothetical protein
MTQGSDDDRLTRDHPNETDSETDSEADGEKDTVSEDRITANQRDDDVRRTGDDEPVHPVAAGETDPEAAADPTIPPDSPHGRPTGAG